MNLTNEERRWAQKVSEKLNAKYAQVRERSAEKIPYIARGGVHDNKLLDDPNWWTNGFWAGLMWQQYKATGEERYAEVARFTENALDKCLEDYLGLHHDVGFMWLLSAVADYRLTDNERSKVRGLHAASLLAGRFNPAGDHGFIRAWNGDWGDKNTGWAIIDCMMNIPLLHWASEETGDPRFRHIAERHAATVRSHFIREDGSARHIVEFDPETGAYVDDFGGQGYEKGSAWTRGQSWALYGFVMSYKHTQRQEYLDTVRKVGEFFLQNIPDDGLIPIDFRQPAEPRYMDDIAGAVAACAYIELAEICGEHRYMDAALRLLHALDEQHIDWDPARDGLLTHCSAAYHSDSDRHVNMVYGDYFFVEAIRKLCGNGVWLW